QQLDVDVRAGAKRGKSASVHGAQVETKNRLRLPRDRFHAELQGLAHFSFSSCLRIPCSSFRCSALGLGYRNFKSLSVSRMMRAMMRWAFILSSAGTMYQGASAELVALKASS